MHEKVCKMDINLNEMNTYFVDALPDNDAQDNDDSSENTTSAAAAEGIALNYIMDNISDIDAVRKEKR